MPVFGHGQEVAHGVHAASLPAGSLEHPTDRGFQAGVRVGDHEAHAVRVPFDESAQELGPERLVLGVPDIDAEDLSVAVSPQARRDHHGLEVTWPASRT